MKDKIGSPTLQDEELFIVPLGDVSASRGGKSWKQGHLTKNIGQRKPIKRQYGETKPLTRAASKLSQGSASTGIVVESAIVIGN